MKKLIPSLKTNSANEALREVFEAIEMKQKILGRTDLKVSSIGLGTVSLCTDYGIQNKGGNKAPIRKEIKQVLMKSYDKGINFFDTAPAYGDSEQILGDVFRGKENCYIATKVSIPKKKDKSLSAKKTAEAVTYSIHQSLKKLRRDVLDILQVHNATLDILNCDEIMNVLAASKKKGCVRFLGASVYTEKEALEVIRKGCFDSVQVAYNILDQQMARKVFDAAADNGLGIIVRSALLKGVLTSRALWLPPRLKVLQEHTEKIKNSLHQTWESLPETAFRFCLSDSRIGTVLAGAASLEELDQALKAAAKGPLSKEMLRQANHMKLDKERLLNPVYWNI